MVVRDLSGRLCVEEKEMALILGYRELQAFDVTVVEPAISDWFICSYNQSFLSMSEGLWTLRSSLSSAAYP